MDSVLAQFTPAVIAIIVMVAIVGVFTGYMLRERKDPATKVTPLQIFGMCAFLLYFIAAVFKFLEFNEVTLSIILTFIGGETVGEFIKGKQK